MTDRLADLTARHALMDRSQPIFQIFRAILLTRGQGSLAMKVALEARHPRSKAVEIVQRAIVAPGRTDDDGFGSAFADLRPAAAALVELTKPRTVLGRLTGYRNVPLQTRVPRQQSGSLVGWTQQGAPSIVSAPSLDMVTLPSAKVTGIIVVTLELLQLGTPSANALIDADLVRAVGVFMDQAFLDPLIGPQGDAPGSITYGASEVSATGTDREALEQDLDELVAAALAGGSDLEQATLVMSKRMAQRIARMTGSEKLGVNGGELAGLPVLTTVTPAMSDGGSPASERIALLDPSLILLGDEGIDVGASEQATLEMSTTPDSPATGSTTLVSLWQEHLSAAKVVRTVNWKAARPGAAAYISGGRYGLAS